MKQGWQSHWPIGLHMSNSLKCHHNGRTRTTQNPSGSIRRGSQFHPHLWPQVSPHSQSPRPRVLQVGLVPEWPHLQLPVLLLHICFREDACLHLKTVHYLCYIECYLADNEIVRRTTTSSPKHLFIFLVYLCLINLFSNWDLISLLYGNVYQS